MLRMFGGVLIFSGGLLARRAWVETCRREQSMRRELEEAFLRMADEIHVLRTPLPVLLRRQCGRETERFFQDIISNINKYKSIDMAWRKSSERLALPSADRAAISSVGQRVGGEEESVCAALMLCAAELHRNREAVEAGRMERERLITAVCVSISLFLTIFLA